MALCAKVPVVSWFDDMSDRELLNLIPFFEALADIDDVYTFLGTADQVPNHTDAATSPPTPDNIDDDAQIDCETSTAEDAVEQEE